MFHYFCWNKCRIKSELSFAEVLRYYNFQFNFEDLQMDPILFLQVFTVPATNLSSRRNFNYARLVLSDRRPRLDPEKSTEYYLWDQTRIWFNYLLFLLYYYLLILIFTYHFIICINKIGFYYTEAMVNNLRDRTGRDGKELEY
jgi:hypothetical protein